MTSHVLLLLVRNSVPVYLHISDANPADLQSAPSRPLTRLPPTCGHLQSGNCASNASRHHAQRVVPVAYTSDCEAVVPHITCTVAACPDASRFCVRYNSVCLNFFQYDPVGYAVHTPCSLMLVLIPTLPSPPYSKLLKSQCTYPSSFVPMGRSSCRDS